MAKKINDDDGMILARGLVTLAAGQKFCLDEGADVQRAFAMIVRTFERCQELEAKIKELESRLKPQLKVAS